MCLTFSTMRPTNAAYVALVILCMLICRVKGHGRMIDPPSRASMWRFGFDLPQQDYDDNQGFCGGRQQQWSRFKGRCGVCGDPYQPLPRPHERGGRFYAGTPTKTYNEGDVISITTEITANHRGWFEFKLCPYDNPAPGDIEQDQSGNFVEVSQQCLDNHILLTENDEPRWYLKEPFNVGTYTVRVKLPWGLTCNNCLLQWKWNVANSWGQDPDGTSCIGCGAQEQFYACADVVVRSSGSGWSPDVPDNTPVYEPPFVTESSPPTFPFIPPTFPVEPSYPPQPSYTPDTQPPYPPQFPPDIPTFFPPTPFYPPSYPPQERPFEFPTPDYPPNTPVFPGLFPSEPQPPIPFPTFFPLVPRQPDSPQPPASPESRTTSPESRPASPEWRPPSPELRPTARSINSTVHTDEPSPSLPTYFPDIPALFPDTPATFYPPVTSRPSTPQVNFWKWLSQTNPLMTAKQNVKKDSKSKPDYPWWISHTRTSRPAVSWWDVFTKRNPRDKSVVGTDTASAASTASPVISTNRMTTARWKTTTPRRRGTNTVDSLPESWSAEARPETRTTSSPGVIPEAAATQNPRDTSNFPWWIYFGEQKQPFAQLPIWLGGDYKPRNPVVFSGLNPNDVGRDDVTGIGEGEKRHINAAAGRSGPPGSGSDVIPDVTLGNGQKGWCSPVGVWTQKPDMWEWCAVNCALGNCPSTHCICSKGLSQDDER